MTLEKLKEAFGVHYEYIEIPNIGRNDLARFLTVIDAKKAVEIGVASGDYSEIIMVQNPQLEMWGVDPYTKYEGYHDYKLRSTFERMESKAHQKLKEYDTYHFVRKFSVDAAKDFKDESLDFVYIDGNHSGQGVKEDMEAWFPKIKKDGLMAGHDFTNRWPGLKKQVINFAQRNNRQLFVLGLERKDLGIYRDTSRSWLIVK